MRKFLIILSILVVTVLGIASVNKLLKLGAASPPALEASDTTPPEVSSLSQTPKMAPVANPITFSIPKLNIENVSVESVGLDKEGKMDIPKADENVAWYNLGAKPGERGNAVLAGHLDTKTGAPAVFYDINKLTAGDELKVKAEDGKEYTYEVTDIVRYELAKFPLVEVFGAGDKARLNLITCEGNYDKSSKLYSHRLVVYSELKS